MKNLKKIVLKNGLRLLLVPQAGSLASSVLILVEAGSEYETKPINGVSHFLEHLAFKGTTRRPRPEIINEEFAALGARSNAFTSQEYTGYWAKSEAHKLPKILDIVSDLYLNPIFDPAEIEKERGVVIEELNMYEDIPMQKLQRLFMALMYGDQPAGWEVGGTKKILQKMTREEIIDYRTRRYVPSGTVVVVSGKFDEKKAIAAVKKFFGGLRRQRAPERAKVFEKQRAPQLHVEFKESDQSHIAMGFRAFDLFDKRRYAFQVLADILGGGMSSRLWKRVREEMGAAYYVSADAELFLDHGILGISAGVNHEKVHAVIAAILEECRTISRELVPEKELQKSKDHMVGGLILGLETSDELGSFFGGQEILTGSLLPPQAIIDRIRKVTAAEVRGAAKSIFKNRGMNLAVIGPFAKKSIFKKNLIL
jgi:predicted Zn-dependent peptidase